MRFLGYNKNRMRARTVWIMATLSASIWVSAPAVSDAYTYTFEPFSSAAMSARSFGVADMGAQLLQDPDVSLAWLNPAAWARLGRPEVSVSYGAGNFDGGRRAAVASYTLPGWRGGLGVMGIPLGESHSLPDERAELNGFMVGAGGGVRLGTFAFGTTAKYLRGNLRGSRRGWENEASRPTVDVGMSWVGRTGAGVSILFENYVEQRVNYSVDSPTVISYQGSGSTSIWRYRVGASSPWLARVRFLGGYVADNSAAERFRYGAELRLHDAVTVRGALIGLTGTAIGLSIRLGGVRADVGTQSQPVGDVGTAFTLTYGFGPEPQPGPDLVLDRGGYSRPIAGGPRRPIRSVEPGGKVTMAVADLSGYKASSDVVVAMTEALIDELAKAGVAVVLERRKIHLLFEEMKFNASGCVDVECAQEMGKMLGVQVMVVGTVQKLDEQYRLTLRAVRVETGAIVGTAKSVFPNLRDLDQSAGDAVYQLVDSMGYTVR